MNRVTNHIEGGISDVYDTYGYEDENKQIMKTVGDYLLVLAAGKDRNAGKVVEVEFKKSAA
jgi:hypothetical protein